MTTGIRALIDELTEQATMKFDGRLVAKVQREVGVMARKHRLTLGCPLPCWDSMAMGVALSKEIKIAGKLHRSTASFALTEREQDDESAIRTKTIVAIQAIELMVISQIRPLKDKTRAAPAEPSEGVPVDARIQPAPDRFTGP